MRRGCGPVDARGSGRCGAADGLQLKAQVAADLLARQAKHEFGRGVAALSISCRHVEEEGRQPLFGPHTAEEHHGILFATDLPRQEMIEVLLQRRDAVCKLIQPVKREDADLGVFQCGAVTAVSMVIYAIEPQDVARHVI